LAVVALSSGGSGYVSNRFIGSGGVTIGGTALVNSNWKGLYVDEWGMAAVCENLEPVFGVTPAPDIVVPIPLISQCGCTDIPQMLQLSHNVGDSENLNSFLSRNGLEMSSLLNISYRRLTESWRGNYHFIGAANGGTTERWDFMFEWGCTNEVYGTSNATLWKLGIYAIRKNEQTGVDFDSRIMVLFDPEPLCTRFNNDGIDLWVQINPFTKRVTVASKNATVESSVFFDGVGLFKSALWRRKPLEIRLRDLGQFGKIPRYDISPIFPKAGELDLT
jgi:hypothetical protein